MVISLGPDWRRWQRQRHTYPGQLTASKPATLPQIAFGGLHQKFGVNSHAVPDYALDMSRARRWAVVSITSARKARSWCRSRQHRTRTSRPGRSSDRASDTHLAVVNQNFGVSKFALCQVADGNPDAPKSLLSYGTQGLPIHRRPDSKSDRLAMDRRSITPTAEQDRRCLHERGRLSVGCWL